MEIPSPKLRAQRGQRIKYLRVFLLIQALPFVWFGCAHGSRCRIDTLIEHYTKLQESRVLIWRLVLVFMFTESFVDQRIEYISEAAYSIGIGNEDVD